ncbi:MAG: nucleotidyltransferase family protein [Chloroflexota bacterium]|nr:nucleotidyltransferase family protein [Chloroflexota bacterium]
MNILNVEAIAALCRRYRVRSLSLFGSAARGEMGADSDYDFLVEFEPPYDGYADRYFGLLEGLQALLGRPVDLVVAGSIRNPYLLRAIQESHVQLYAA